MRSLRHIASASAALVAGPLACASLSGLSGGEPSADSGVTHHPDASKTKDATSKDVVSEAGQGSDAWVEASTDAIAEAGEAGRDGGVVTYNDFTDHAFWTTFDLTTVNGGAFGYTGGTFDGRYVYLTPGFNEENPALATRYDTHAGFTTVNSWATFDTTTVSNFLGDFSGAAFDGRYVYFPPQVGVVARYDTQNSFTNPLSWADFDVSALTDGATDFASFQGAVFDGTYVYFVPQTVSSPDGGIDMPSSGIVLRLDPTGDFRRPTAWSTFNVATVSAGAAGFEGGVFDGRYLYLVPNYASVAARYDTLASFTSASSWTTFDTSLAPGVANGLNGGFVTGAFDGRYVYFVPNLDTVVTRYDTQSAAFSDPGSWTTFDTTKVDAISQEFFGAAFDGRYLYLVPYTGAGNPSGALTRYDTTATFTTKSSWATFQTGSLAAGVGGFNGAVFDGEYLYLIPYSTDPTGSAYSGLIARFQAKTPRALPPLPHFSGSFY